MPKQNDETPSINEFRTLDLDLDLDPMKTIAAPEQVTINLEAEATPSTAEGPGDDRADGRPRPPQPPGGFEVLEEIGRGGMGVVYRARQRPLARQIALKRLPSTGDLDEHAYLQFLSEALVAGHLDHPNIVPVYTLEPDEDGNMSMAMKLVEGVSWLYLLHPDGKHRERAEAYTLERHLEVLLNVCNAVAFAHSRDIIHRDLKPENVMVGEFGEVFVMDWGIALSISGDPKRDSVQRARHKSLVSAPAGTPAYMAPEMADARGDAMGPWTDVYLLGATLYEVLTGRPPHGSGSLEEILEAARQSEITFPDETVPEALRVICRKAMAREPGDRYPSATDFGEALRGYLGHRQSLLVSDKAGARLARVRGEASGQGGDRPPMGTDTVYGELFEIIAAYGQALDLWSGNTEAEEGRRAARMCYAEAAYREGDYKLARSQLQHLEGPEAAALLEKVDAALLTQQQSAAVTRTLRRTLIAAGALVFALMVTVAFAAITTRKMALSISETMHELLIDRAVGDLRVNHAAVSAKTTLLNIEKAEIALQAYAGSVEAAFRGPPPPLREPIYYTRNVDTGEDAPPGLVRDVRYEHTGPDGRRIASPVTFEEQTFFLAPGLEAAAARDDIARAQGVLPTLRALRAPRTAHVIRYFTGMESGLYFAYPGHGLMPEDYDNRVRPWYVEGRMAQGLLRTRPYIDTSSRRVVVSFEQPVRRVDGSLLGVSGVDVDMTDLIHTSELPEMWAARAEVFIANPLRGEDGAVWLEVKGEAGSGSGDDHAARLSMTDWDVPTQTLRGEGEAFAAMVDGMLAGKTDVAHLPRGDTPSLWAFAPVGLDGASMLIIVPDEAVTEDASFVKDRIQALSLGHIRRLLALVVVILVLVPVGTWLVRRNLAGAA